MMKNKPSYTEEKEGIFLPNNAFRTHIIADHDETPHTHEFVEIFYILQGSVFHYHNGGQKEFLTAGDMMIIPPFFDEHYFKRIKDTPCLHRDIIIMPELLESACRYFNISSKKLFSRTNGVVKSMSLADLDSVETQVNRILKDTSKENENRAVLTRLLIANLISRFLIAENAPKQENSPPWFNTFLALFTKADIIKVGLPALKKHMVLSYEHVCRQHKKITGKTIVEHLTETRMAYAAHLLTTTDMSILEIAMEVGYNSLSHFNHTFKKHYNISPNAYKQHPHNI